MEIIKSELIANTAIDKNFIDKFIDTVDKDDFCIILNDNFKWLGFSRLDHSKNLLLKPKLGFIENEDYIINNIGTGQAYKKEEIILKPETFKMLAMCAQTSQGQITRKYYIKLETEYRKLCIKYSEETIKSPFDNKTTFNYVDISKYKNMWVCYVIHIENDLYKFGYSGDFIKRCEQHKQQRNWINVVEVFNAFTKENASEAELKFLRYIEANNLKVDNYIDNTSTKPREIFKATENIDKHIWNYGNFVKEAINNNHKKFNDFYEKEENIKKLDLELTNRKIIEFQEKNKVNSEFEYIIKSVTESLTQVINKNLEEFQVKLATLENKLTNVANTKFIEVNNAPTEIITDDISNNISNEIITNVISIKCKKCKKNKEQTEENYRIKNDKTFSVNCISCLEKDKERCDKNREERNEYNKKYTEAQKKKIEESNIPLHKCGKCAKTLEINDSNFEKNEENNFKKICISCNIIINENREIINQKHREYCAKTDYDKLQYEKHKDKKLQQKKLKYNENIENFQEKNKNYYEDNKDKILEQKKEKYTDSKNEII